MMVAFLSDTISSHLLSIHFHKQHIFIIIINNICHSDAPHSNNNVGFVDNEGSRMGGIRTVTWYHVRIHGLAQSLSATTVINKNAAVEY